MDLGLSYSIGLILAALAAAGCLFEIIAIGLLLRFFGRPMPHVSAVAGATLLKPLRGTEPRLSDNLESFLAQDYPGPLQMVCGLDNGADVAAGVAERLRNAHADRDIALVIQSTAGAPNGKVANLANMVPAARHDILVISDSDIAVTPDYLSAIAGTLVQPGVGAVTCAYRGRGDAGLWSKVSAGCIGYIGLPGVIVGYLGGMARPCMGSTIALKRDTLNAIGGFERFTEVLADDYAIGEAVAEIGYRVEFAPILLVHACAERSLATLWRQKVRWSATIRGVAPMRHLGSVITFPLALALMSALFVPVIGLPLALAALGLRFVVAIAVDSRHGERCAPYWMLPAIECIEFLAFAASFVTRKIDWRGSRLTMRRDGRIAV